MEESGPIDGISPERSTTGDDTAAEHGELRGHARRGSAVTLASQLAKALVQFAGLALLSRLVSPTAFGVLAVIVAIVTLGELVRDFGLTTAAIQAKQLTKAQANNVFWLNTAVGVCLSATCALTAPWLADLLNEPDLVTPLRVTGLTFVLLGLQAQFQVQLVRSLRFGFIAGTDVLCQFLSFGVALALALGGAEVWALVAQVLVLNMSLLVTRAALARWWPGLPSRKAGTKRLLNYGIKLGAAQILTYGANFADTYSISIRYSAFEVGLYSRAFQLLTLPVNQLLVPLTNVFLPILARLRSDPTAYIGFLLRWQFALCSGAVLAFGIAVPLAPDIIHIVLGDQWQASATIFRLLAIGGAVQVFSFVNYWIFLSLGLTGELLRYNLLTKPASMVAIFVASTYSVNAVAGTYAACLAISWPINIWWLSRVTEFEIMRLFWLGMQILVAGTIAAGCAQVVRQSELPGSIGLAVLAGAATFVLVELALPRTREHCRALRRAAPSLSA
jgi:PST family polysaccharide transporter